MKTIKKILCLFAFAGIAALVIPSVNHTDEVQAVERDTSKVQDEISDQTGWVRKAEGWYYYDAQGRKITGWLYEEGEWYYLDGNDKEYPGRMASEEELEINGKIYCFNRSGVMKTGWVKETEGWYYYSGSGAKITGGWGYINGFWYYFLNENENKEYPGLMFNGSEAEINGIEYYFYTSGAMKTGWMKENDSWYYLNSNGHKVNGWIYVNGIWYYMDPDNEGRMFDAGWKKLNDVWYYLRSNGAMATGWVYDGNWYYMSSSGAMLSGWQLIGNEWYYLYVAGDSNGGPYGAMAYNQMINGYWVDADGKWVPPHKQEMNNLAQGYSSSTSYLILVNTSTHKVGIYTGSYGDWKNILYWDCGDGAPETPSVKGIFTVGIRGYYFDSDEGRCFWYTQFYGDYLFHSVPYDENGEVRDGRLGMSVSHGCIRLEINNAKWIYDNIPDDTTVVVY